MGEPFVHGGTDPTRSAAPLARHQGSGVLNPDSLFLARATAGMSRDDLAARAAAIGHSHVTGDAHEFLRQDLREYVELAEHDQLEDLDELPPTHPYIAWFAQALGTS